MKRTATTGPEQFPIPDGRRIGDSQVDASGIKHPKKRAMIAAFAQLGTIAAACHVAQVPRGTHDSWYQRDRKYRALFDEAREVAADLLEAEVRRRAVEGIERPVFYRGVQCGSIRQYSDTLLMFLAKALNPERFGCCHCGAAARDAGPSNVVNAQQIMIEFDAHQRAMELGGSQFP